MRWFGDGETEEEEKLRNAEIKRECKKSLDMIYTCPHCGKDIRKKPTGDLTQAKAAAGVCGQKEGDSMRKKGPHNERQQ